MIGQSLGRYRIERNLGSGGVGVVYRAFDTDLERAVAIKIIGNVPDEDSRAAVLREARAASALNHPHICTIYEVGEFDGRPYLVMEHVEGRTLSQAIPPDGLPPSVVIQYGMQIADALAHAHDRGVIHRDLKGSNVIVSPDQRVKVLDFGLARRVPERQSTAPTESDASLENSRAIAGTVACMAPDVLRGRPPDPRDDIWALGVVLYEAVTGRQPFSGDTTFHLASAIQRDEPAPMAEDVPAGLRVVILRCLARTRAERYQHAREVNAALEALHSGVTIRPRPWVSRRIVRRTAMVLGAAVIVAAIGAETLRRAGFWSRAVESIAILPFVSAGSDPGAEYLSDGLTEAVIHSLSQVPREKLKVIALTPVLRYRGPEVDVRRAGRELGVRAVVLGRVTLRDGALTVSVELVSSQDRSRLWGDTYTAPLRDIVSVQREVATRITDGLRLQLSGGERQRMAKLQTENAEAYQLYLRGRSHWYKFTPDDYTLCLEYYQQAIDRDPQFALAYAGIASARVMMAYEGLVPPREARRASEAAALKALSIDDTIGEAHQALAEIRFAHDWSWVAAEQEYRRAVALTRDPATRRFYGHFLRALGRWDEAIAEMTAALEPNPFDVETNKALGATFFWAGQTDRAIEQYRKTLEIDPSHSQTHELLADAYASKGLYLEALAELRTSLTLDGADEAAEALGPDASEAGYRRAIRMLHTQVLARLKEETGSRYISPMVFAMTYIALDDKERAFEWLEEAYKERAPWLASLKSDPAFKPIRSDRRFMDLVRRVGLP